MWTEEINDPGTLWREARVVGRSAPRATVGVAKSQKTWCELIRSEEPGQSDESGHVRCAGSACVDAGPAARGLEERGMGLGYLPGGIFVGGAVG
jgi:hypothetical protein